MTRIRQRSLSNVRREDVSLSDGVCGRLLVVDDNQDFLAALRILLANTPHDYVLVDEGPAALREAEKSEFDLLLTDVRMEPVDGVTLARRIKEVQPLIAVIMMTGFDKGDTPLQALRLGASDYIDKPIRDVQAFFRLLDHHVKLVKSEKLLRSTKARLETVIDNVDAGVVVLDAQGVIEQLNDAARRQLQILGSDPVGQPFRQVCPMVELYRLTETRSRQSIALDVPLEGKTQLLHVDATPLTFAAGKSIGTVLLVKDLTHLAEMQKAEGWRQMSRVITHAMKTPLATLRLRLERLIRASPRGRASADQLPGQSPPQDQPLEDSPRSSEPSPDEDLQTLLAVVDELHARVADLVEFVKLEIVLAPTDLNATVISAVKQFAPHRRPEVEVEFEPDGSIPSLNLCRKAVVLALENLLSNSQDALTNQSDAIPPDDRLWIRVCTRWDESARVARVTVEDNGPGVPESIRAELFRRPINSTKPGGSGLGAALVKHIVEQHGGTLHWESPAGSHVGTRVTLYFPSY